MSKTLDFILISNEEGNAYVVDSAYLSAVDLSKEELLKAYGDRAKEHKVVFKAQSFSMKREVNRQAQVPDLVTGVRLDPDLIPAARAAVVVDHWSFDVPVSVSGFESLPYLVAEYISAAINQYLFPDLARDPDFFGLLTSKVQSSEVKPQPSLP